ncbi:MAG: hypothetical protein KJO79_10875 [Verrucomicrobiae bacterium]|nr:hypothetical protein [Verrucomicrobiae bacterium]NNJ87677.1 hypothetical protein [Akkermansiaceae bacterium]
MPTYAYQVSFPCPECGGVLTMSVKCGEGNCPLCNADIYVNLDVQKGNSHSNSDKSKDNTPGRGWDNRAFRRPSNSEKPMWQPFHHSAE